MSEDRLESWYKKQADQVNGQPPSYMWEDIAADLDAGATPPWYRRWALGGIALLLLLASSMAWYILSDSDPEALAAFDSSNDTFEGHPGGWVQNGGESQLVSSNNGLNYSLQESLPTTESTSATSNYDQFNGASAAVDSRTASVAINDLSPIISGDNQPQVLSLGALSMIPAISPYSEVFHFMRGRKMSAPELSHEEKIPLGYWLGANLGVSNLWAINDETLDGFKPQSLISNNLSFGMDYSLNGGVFLSERWAVESELFLHKSQGQSFTHYGEGKLVTQKTRLGYSRLSLRAKRRIEKGPRFGVNRSVLNVVAGPYVGFLRNANRDVAGENTLVTDDYLKFDYGFDLGLEHDFYVSERVIFSTGLRSSTGLRNVFAAGEQSPSLFDRSRNFSLGVNVGVKLLLGEGLH